ncbi:lytic polysaccharide monooxygenase auxiliary activity family 9 protein [Streptomyces ficellus]|uniref:LPXTG cell wall anchor domain-containing protein n=1 Tax=Streptomyces ficellus TaxID=1977088 RepID=A0A6I6FPE9_9ACTN|nr:lytic polysaccharide monooxygenase [Streptomyces ficellus]QGV81395.1 LPXTG cell wall anchor domain-containing protein [Streptomyces ficellus]
MTPRRKPATVAAAVALGIAPLALTGLTASPAMAHGTMTDPVSRVSACYAEGPESPDSAACKAAVAASGPQAFYDWNEVNIANAAGKHKQVIPDGKLCSAGRDKYKGLDLPRGDWPSSKLAAGKHTFRYKATAPHKGSFELYLTKDGYDPSKPLKWSDLEAKPFAKVTNPRLESGAYVFDGTVPAKSGRHLVYSVWQRSDSPEAFYTCSDVVFGKESAPAPTASAPSEAQIEDGQDKSTVGHGGHGGDDHPAEPSAPASPEGAASPAAAEPAPAPAAEQADTLQAQGAGTPSPVAAAADENLAETGGSTSTPYLAAGGAAVLAVGAAVLFATTRRRATR